MIDPKDAQAAINNFIREKMEPSQDTKAYFSCEWAGGTIRIFLMGKKKSKLLYIWDREPVIGQLAEEYRMAMKDTIDLAEFTIEIDLESGEFVYTHFPVPERDLQKEKEAEEEAKKTAQYLAGLRKKYEALSETYGAELAEKTAKALQKRGLNYYHRDYCGMGLGWDKATGVYFYGQVYDGYVDNSQLRFPDREKFVEWLSGQSDASLARLDALPSYWGDQVITRQRLEEFVASVGPV